MKIGTLVECVDDRFNAEQLEKIRNRPKKGNHYMIREIIKLGHLVGVLLEEVHIYLDLYKKRTLSYHHYRINFLKSFIILFIISLNQIF